ncbi:hypothetical protein V8B55DRAFT_1545979 [Mucor lusitanicus]|uniref:AN1-type domain-containing protein n=2 Tax=Mucor circinelloides f. lusitanicus TaxID=29924 RepID=A0A168NSH3_MUCCL|nr:hypothetical protein FB192DRAFT_1146623 [Mucor lusitanicus]OAD06674.1 hypothetical protein MUCCIDRAFT_107257 [Mucor lusitanicus CBS 277.49]
MELPQIGKNCQLDGCNSLDFLPVACPLCHQTFCGDHRLPSNHKCSHWNQVTKDLVQCDDCQQLIQAPKDAKLGLEQALEQHKQSKCHLYLYPPSNTIKKIDRQCTVKGCRDIDPRIGPVHCNGCDQDFCLKHRHPASHSCQSLDTDEQRKMERKLAAQEKVAKTFTSQPTKKRKVITSVPVRSKNGGMVELMKIKSQAKGSPSVPAASRIYIYVQGPKESKVDSQSVYFDKKNSVGKALDLIADICKVNNKNNTLPPSDPERLELYKCPDMTILDKSEPLEKALKNLDTVLLERQGAVSMEEVDDLAEE